MVTLILFAVRPSMLSWRILGLWSSSAAGMGPGRTQRANFLVCFWFETRLKIASLEPLINPLKHFGYKDMTKNPIFAKIRLICAHKYHLYIFRCAKNFSENGIFLWNIGILWKKRTTSVISLKNTKAAARSCPFTKEQSDNCDIICF